jgi:NADH-quinone oxidoreductase subunit D
MKQSVFLIKQCCLLLTIQETNNFKLSNIFKQNLDMAYLISHFKFYSEGFFIKKNNIYIALEAPKGEMGVFLASNGSYKPFRCKIRAPGFFHLNSINSIIKNHTIADAVVVIGSQDIVFGEVDR